MGAFRNKLKIIHRKIDSIVGSLFGRHTLLRYSPQKSTHKFNFDNFNQYSYSKLSHFTQFNTLSIYNKQTPSTCDLKVYQDLFIYNFIIDNIPKGSKILEIGGGDSRIVSCLKNEYEFWNLDKLEGEGYGPKLNFNTYGYYLIQDYIGSFSKQLPENFFDFVFSVSVIEHFPEDAKSINNIILDFQRILKKNAISLHCVDSLLFNDHLWVHPIIFNLKSEFINGNFETNFEVIKNDRDLWTLSKYAYYTRWFPITLKKMDEFGQPFSLNIYWKNIS